MYPTSAGFSRKKGTNQRTVRHSTRLLREERLCHDGSRNIALGWCRIPDECEFVVSGFLPPLSKTGSNNPSIKLWRWLLDVSAAERPEQADAAGDGKQGQGSQH